MKNIPSYICRKMRQLRRDRGISQTDMAAAIGCKQPALSMFEAGDGTKLSDEMVKKLAERLGVPFESLVKPPPPAEADASGAAGTGEPFENGGIVIETGRGYCPDCRCPSNIPHIVGDRVVFRPVRRISSPVPGAKRCAECGEVLEKACPVCGAELNDGACCVSCGSPYVTAVLPPGVDAVRWVRDRQAEISALYSLPV